MSLAPGKTIGVYHVVALIGAGGMGEVYKARDTKLGRDVALKVLPDFFAGDAHRLARFQREAEVLASLNHPNIATIHGLEEADGVCALVLEFVEGPTLAGRIAQGAISLDEVLPIARQVAEALEAAHERAIVHRDLKPSNIKVRPDGLVKVLDFGLAKAVHGDPVGYPSTSPTLTAAHTGIGVTVGTAAYMSPEQARGKPVDKRTDIWAFGCVLYEMLVGRPVFEGETVAEVLGGVLKAEPDWTRLPGETPPEIRRLLRRCLQPDRGRRLHDMADARIQIEEAQAEPRMEGEATRAQRLTTAAAPASHRVERRPRHWGRVAGIAAAILLVAAAVTWRLWERDYFWQNPLANATVERLTDFEGDEEDAAISPDGKFVTFLSDRSGRFDAWVSQIGSGEFVNISKGQFPTLSPGAGVLPRVGFSGDGTQVWITDQATQQRYSTLIAPAVGGVPRPFVHGIDPVWSPDGSKIAYHTPAPGDPIFVADRNGSDPRQIFIERPGIHCHHLTWSPDGRYIYFVKGTPPTEEMDIWRIQATTGGGAATAERITFHNARVAYPAWLDARTLIYSTTAEDGSGQWLYSVDVEHRIPHRVSSGIAEQYLSIAASRTNPRRLIATVAIPSASLWTIPVSDGIETEGAASRLPAPNIRALAPRFASEFLLFLSSKGGSDGLWKLEKGSASELWRGSEGGVVASPAVSPDGSQIIFSYRKQGRASLFVMNANGTNMRTLSSSLDVRGAASWSPDGKWVAVAGNQGQGTRVFKIPVDSGQPVQMVDKLSYNPVWSPDGAFIVYSEQQGGGEFEVKAVTPDKVPVRVPNVRVSYSLATPYRFVPYRQVLIALEGGPRAQNFFWVDMNTGKERQLTDLKHGFVMQNFDVSPDGKQIVFDRLRDNSDIVVMNLPK